VPTSDRERARIAYEAMNRGDFDGALQTLAPDIEWTDPPEWPERRDVQGREAVKEMWLRSVEPFESFRFETLEFIEGADRSFHALRLSGTGTGSGAPVEMLRYQVSFAGPDGLAARLENYFDRDQALRAAGINR